MTKLFKIRRLRLILTGLRLYRFAPAFSLPPTTVSAMLAGNLFVVIEFHRKGAASLCVRAKIGGITEHGREGNECLDGGGATGLGFHAFDFGATSEDRSPMMSPMYCSGMVTSTRMMGSSSTGRALGAGFESHRASNLERHFARIHFVVGAIVQE